MDAFWKLLTDGAFTALILGIAKLAFDKWERAKDRGHARTEREIREMSVDVKSLRSDLEAAEETDRVLLHDRIWQIFYELRDRESITVEEDANLDYLYSEYEKKNGNHKAKAMYKFLKKKPVVADLEEEEDENDV